MSNKSKIATVMLAGLAAGAAVYYLLATDNGKETCDKLSSSLKNLGGLISDLKDKAADSIDQISGQADKLAGSVKLRVQSAV
ncbi:YtxH domain-containing protein [Pedobacter sp. BS3]|uniref:YtxH domain-containing protein n=1 Tax=Pedobacter sp. BS3 TaxID=2567937 RepID=UPI0011EE60A0|nr:YtxH domain-containing protein [Pedobacter sp. BS3]TZF82719.1 YtxH domain-containing protein [Pedobacter sp. BS3]